MITGQQTSSLPPINTLVLNNPGDTPADSEVEFGSVWLVKLRGKVTVTLFPMAAVVVVVVVARLLLLAPTVAVE